MKKLWIDTETTGLDHKKCAIWQIHAISECNGSLREFGAVMRPHPEAVIEPGALDMLQAAEIDTAKLYSFPEQIVIFNKFLNWLKEDINQYDKTDKFTIYGYNVGFDVSFIREWFLRCHNDYFGSFFWQQPVDVMSLAADLLIEQRPLFNSFKLASVAAFYSLSPRGSMHDAATDIRLTRELYLCLKNGEQ